MASITETTTRFIFFRHGETARNFKGEEIQGWIDDKDAQLNGTGQKQAEQLGQQLATAFPGLSLIYSSPLGRCKETASRIAKCYPSMAIQFEDRLKEICHGQHDTMSLKTRNEFCLQEYDALKQQFRDDHPDQPLPKFLKWETNPLMKLEIPAARRKTPFPGKVETIKEVFERATAVLKEIATKYPGKTILISTHSAVIETLRTEAEYRVASKIGALPVYYEPKMDQKIDEAKSSIASKTAEAKSTPKNCVAYDFSWQKESLTYTGTLDLHKV